MGLSGQARLDDGFARGQAAAQAGSGRPTPGSHGFESSNLTNAWLAGFDSYRAPEPESHGGGDWGGGGEMLPSAPQQRSEPRPAPVAPTMPTLPALTMSDGASTSYQLNKMQSIDSVPMQQAEIQAHERGVASGAIHSSQQGGAAQRAVQNAMTPLAQSEASLVGSEEIANWSAEVKRLTDIYEKQYAGYLAELGIQSNERIGMMQANTSLSTTLMGNVTSLMNNPEIEFGEEVKNKLTSIFNGALMNNNTILDMGFSYA